VDDGTALSVVAARVVPTDRQAGGLTVDGTARRAAQGRTGGTRQATRVPARPRLRPGLPRAWRDPSTLQLGLSPTSGGVVTGLADGDDLVIAALDGTRTRRQLRELVEQQGRDPERVDTIVRMLGDAGLLVAQRAATDRVDLGRLPVSSRRRLHPDADAWSVAYRDAGDGVPVVASRATRHVHVIGDGRVASAVVTTLASAGVGTVTVSNEALVRDGDVLPAGPGAADVGSSAAESLHRAVTRVRPDAPSRERQHPAPTRPDAAVLLGDDVLDSRRGDELVRHDVPHLAVVTSAEHVVIGPLVLPGRTACLRCLDLHRRDRDPAWPQVLAQLLGQSRRSHGRAETASATAAAGLVALQVLVLLDGHATPVSVGRTLELSLPQGLVDRRSWRLHPSCGCARLPAVPDPGTSRVATRRASA
jgi:bacteriocin biosynthesis cyclodehydratase domain-containing protein